MIRYKDRWLFNEHYVVEVKPFTRNILSDDKERQVGITVMTNGEKYLTYFVDSVDDLQDVLDCLAEKVELKSIKRVQTELDSEFLDRPNEEDIEFTRAIQDVNNEI